MNDKYVVLRSVPAPPRAGVRRGGAVESAVPARNISISTSSASELPRLQKDPDVAAFAPSLPMRLIQPVSKLSVDGTAKSSTADEIAWGVRAVGAHDCRFTGEGITVAVLDTGIDTRHRAFEGVEFLQQDFTGEGPEDQHGHGTHCAGTIFGRVVDGTRIGVAPGVTRALNGKVLGANGGSSEALLSAIIWAVQNGAHVISMSLGMDFPGYQKALMAEGLEPELATSMALEGYRQNVTLFERLATLLRAGAQPCTVVAAAGNESRRTRNPPFRIAASPPAVSEGIISVAALGMQGEGLEVAVFSNTGALVSGPGVDIVSAAPAGGLQMMSGTSMAAPHVAGVAALWAQKLKAEGLLNATQLHANVISSARRERLVAGSQPIDVGAGLTMAPPN